MGIIKRAELEALRVGLSKVFQSALGQSKPWLDKVAATVPSNAAIQTYGFYDRMIGMREWIGPRVIRNAREYAFEVRNVEYELTFAVDRNDLEDDTIGVTMPKVEMFAQSVAKHPDQLAKAVLQAGTSGLCFDGAAFFSGSHAWLDGYTTAQSNNHTSMALSATNYATVRSRMYGILGSDGEPIGAEPTLLVVPPALEGTARSILFAEMVGNGESNVWRGSAELLVVPELQNEPTVWYLMDTGKPVKPLLKQVRRAPAFVSKNQSTDDNVFFDRELIWGADWRGAVSYGPWFLAHRAVA